MSRLLFMVHELQDRGKKKKDFFGSSISQCSMQMVNNYIYIKSACSASLYSTLGNRSGKTALSNLDVDGDLKCEVSTYN